MMLFQWNKIKDQRYTQKSVKSLVYGKDSILNQ